MKNFLYLLILCICLPVLVYAERGIKSLEQEIRSDLRFALVIGNSNYSSAPLKNPKNDALDIAEVLKNSNFEVLLLLDASQREIDDGIRIFGKKLRKGGAGLFFYAGHGIQVNGRNYLIPIGAKIESESDVKYEAVDAGRVLGKMEDAGNDLNIIILDACRNNPFARSFRSSNKGLAKMDAPKGSLIAYSTAPGSVASDGVGSNGIFTKYLVENIKNPGLTIEQILKGVRIQVVQATSNKQVPWESSSLMGDFYFNVKKNKNTAFVSSQKKGQVIERQVDAEEEMWALVKESKNIKEIKTFLKIYPHGKFKNHAKLILNRIEETNIVNTKPELLVIPAANFNRSQNIEVGVLPYGKDVIHNAKPYHQAVNSAEYDLYFKKNRTSKLYIEYAAHSSRPIDIYLNKKLILKNAIFKTTGGWNIENQKWHYQGDISFHAGNNTLTLHRNDVFPHIRRIKLEFLE